MTPQAGPPPFLSVVMPAYNEEASIGQVVLDHVQMLESMSAALSAWEIVCVDDGSSDRTPQVLAGLQQRVPALRVIRQQNQGICGAVTRAYREARGEVIYSTGSDGQWPAENLPRLFESYRRGADLVIGVRTNRRDVYTLSRRLVSLAFNLMPRILFGAPVKDAGSIKLGKSELFQLELLSRSPFFEAERIIRAQRSGFKVDFVPIRFLVRTGGVATGVKLKNITGSLRDLIRCLNSYGLR